MENTSLPDGLFPASPSDAGIVVPAPAEMNTYLVDGTINVWDGNRQDVVSPVCFMAEGRPEPYRLGSYPLLTETESLRALDAACRAFDFGKGIWPTLSVEDRIRHVEQFVLRMSEQRQRVVELLMWEIGKTLPDAEKEFDRTVDYIRDTIEALKDLDRTSSRFVIEQGILGQIRRSPLGVVLCMGPYNYPLNETFTTLIPALIMGNTIIFKPPKMGVLLHYPLMEAFRDCFPAGVVNMLFGEGPAVIGPLMKSGRIDALAFIGSSRVADILKHQHPRPHRMRSVLGLEAKNAAIVLPDADMELTLNECVLGSLSYNGQRCTAIKIIFVHRLVISAFLDGFSRMVSSLSCGMPWEPGVKITPLPEEGKTAYLGSLVADALAKGASVVNHGGGRCLGTFYFPAVLYPAKLGMRVWSEEQFGPVVPVAVFDDISTPLEYIINSDYGQQVSIFGKNPATIAGLVDPLVNQVCRVNINSQCQRGPDTFPFTGRKDSAEGTLSVSDALRAFSIRSLVAAKRNAVNDAIIRDIVRNNRSNFLSTDFIL